MIEKKSVSMNTGLIIGAMNLLTVGVPMLASHSLEIPISDKKMEQVNMASIKSIESTWLKVPKTCKARAFNASPVSLDIKQIATNIQRIYTFYQV